MGSWIVLDECSSQRPESRERPRRSRRKRLEGRRRREEMKQPNRGWEEVVVGRRGWHCLEVDQGLTRQTWSQNNRQKRKRKR